MLLELLPEEGAKCLDEIRHALAQGDLDAARSFAHRLKGVAGNMGARKLSEIARQVELESDSIEAASDRLPALDAVLTETCEELKGVA